MSVLTQSKSPRAQQLVIDYAKSSADPELQLRAIRYVGRSGTKDTQQQLAAVYPTATDTRVKQEIIRSLMSSGASDSLLAIAKSEKDQNLRNGEHIPNLAASDATPAIRIGRLVFHRDLDPGVEEDDRLHAGGSRRCEERDRNGAQRNGSGDEVIHRSAPGWNDEKQGCDGLYDGAAEVTNRRLVCRRMRALLWPRGPDSHAPGAVLRSHQRD